MPHPLDHERRISPLAGAVPAPVLSASRYQHFSSRGEAPYQERLLSAIRFEFGGYVEKGS